MGPVEGAIRQAVATGDVLSTPTLGKPFKIGEIDSSGIVLLLGKGEWPTRMTWECLEGVVPFLEERGTMPIGGRHEVEGNPGTLDEYLKGCIRVTTAGWVAVVLEQAGVVQIIRQRPALVGLTAGFVG